MSHHRLKRTSFKFRIISNEENVTSVASELAENVEMNNKTSLEEEELTSGIDNSTDSSRDDD